MSKRCCAEMCFNSQTRNKNVAYFGFPKNAKFAKEWAKAAGRQDLEDKSLNNITKYFLCSEHFENQCFADPPHNTILKKTTRPVVVPIPTIFKSNFEKYVPKNTLEAAKKSTIDEITVDDVLNIEGSDEDDSLQKLTEKQKRSIDKTCNSNNTIVYYGKNVDFEDFEEYYMPEKNILSNIIDCSSELEENSTHTLLNELTCRLCGENIVRENLTSIFEDDSIANVINQLMPNLIHKDDGWPQNVCDDCLEKAKYCVDVINSFVAVQDNFQSS